MRWPWSSVLFHSVFQNLLEKPGEKECIQEHALAMVQCNISLCVVFQNLLEKPGEKECIQEHALAMVQCNISLCVSESVREAWREGVYPGTCVGHGSV